jgi:hypothetical protein
MVVAKATKVLGTLDFMRRATVTNPANSRYTFPDSCFMDVLGAKRCIGGWLFNL